MNFENFLEERKRRINSFLADILPNPSYEPSHLHEAMHYAVLNGGKRIRPLLVYATGEAFGIDLKLLDRPASAIELIHAYSLVHDDLPAMDNDDLRRGKPTCHKAFDEATAILVGDALQTLSFGTLSEPSELVPEIRIEMIGCLAKASGSLGMAGGQALDLRATGQKLNQEDLENIHNLKTGALISASVELGLLAAGIKDTVIRNTLLDFANYIGLCFQIQDDILDHEGSTLTLGKLAGADASKQKATFTTIKGLEKSKSSLDIMYQKAVEALKPLGERGHTLRLLAKYIVIRNH